MHFAKEESRFVSLRRLTALCGLVFCLTAPSYAILGVGAHYGIDRTLSMEDDFNDQVELEAETFSVTGLVKSIPNVPSGLSVSLDSLASLLGMSTEIETALPFYASRANLEPTPLAFGGKAYIDIIPILNAVEVSVLFAAWQYDGAMRYPKGIRDDIDVAALGQNPQDIVYEDIFEMDTIPITLESAGHNYLGLNRTPFARLQIDATVRKNILSVPPVVNLVRIYAGGGPTLAFTTPLLTSDLVENAIGERLQNVDGTVPDIEGMLRDKELQKEVLDMIIKEAMQPKFGMHLMAGAMLKLPVVPFGIYVDGKLVIPFGEYDVGLTGTGITLAGGISFGL
jgi:hypothetical protein